MKLTFLILLFAIWIIGSGCKERDTVRSTDLSSRTQEDELEMRRMMENDLRVLYDSCEILLRADGVRDQHKIDAIMQLMIDGGDLTTPYIFENDSAGPKFLTYIEYKVYRSQHPLDTTSAYTFSLSRQDSVGIDSALIKLLSNSPPQ